MKHFLLLSVLLVSACNSSIINTGQDLQVDLVGAEEAYCILSTDGNRYALTAPGTVFVERSSEDLKIDCDDNYSSRRRVVRLEPYMHLNLFSYPEQVTIDFSSYENGSRYNGFRADPRETEVYYKKNARRSGAVTEVLTENSFSKPVSTQQTYPVKKNYTMGRRSSPVLSQSSYSEDDIYFLDPAVTLYPVN